MEPKNVFFEVTSNGLRLILSTSASIASISEFSLAYSATESASPTVAPLVLASIFPVFTAPSTKNSPALTPLIVPYELSTKELYSVGSTFSKTDIDTVSPPDLINLPIAPFTPLSTEATVPFVVFKSLIPILFSTVFKTLSEE